LRWLVKNNSIFFEFYVFQFNFFFTQFKGPTALLGHKLAFGKSITSYPSFKEKLGANFVYKEERVVQDQNLITSQGEK
jgi:hypothetical protein